MGLDKPTEGGRVAQMLTEATRELLKLRRAGYCRSRLVAWTLGYIDNANLNVVEKRDLLKAINKFLSEQIFNK